MDLAKLPFKVKLNILLVLFFNLRYSIIGSSVRAQTSRPIWQQCSSDKELNFQDAVWFLQLSKRKGRVSNSNLQSYCETFRLCRMSFGTKNLMEVIEFQFKSIKSNCRLI